MSQRHANRLVESALAQLPGSFEAMGFVYEVRTHERWFTSSTDRTTSARIAKFVQHTEAAASDWGSDAANVAVRVRERLKSSIPPNFHYGVLICDPAAEQWEISGYIDERVVRACLDEI